MERLEHLADGVQTRTRTDEVGETFKLVHESGTFAQQRIQLGLGFYAVSAQVVCDACNCVEEAGLLKTDCELIPRKLAGIDVWEHSADRTAEVLILNSFAEAVCGEECYQLRGIEVQFLFYCPHRHPEALALKSCAEAARGEECNQLRSIEVQFLFGLPHRHPEALALQREPRRRAADA